MIGLARPIRVFLRAPSTDLRKGFDALSEFVTTASGPDPTSSHPFFFVKRHRDRLKILYWDGDGLAIWYKKQESDCRRTFAFIEIGGHARHLAGWPLAARGMDSRQTPVGPRR
jgi:transposase